MRSTCSGVAIRSCTSRSASAPNGRPQRLTRKPGPSAATITRLPIASPVARASASARSPVWSAGDHLQQLHERGRVEEVHAHHVLGRGGRARERGDRDRRGVRGQHGVGPQITESCANSSRLSSGARAPPRSPGRSRPGLAARGAGRKRAGGRVRGRRAGPSRPSSPAPCARRRARARAPRAPDRGAGLASRRRSQLRDPGAHRAGADHARASPALELRLALLGGAHALDAVLGGHGGHVQAPLLGQARGRGRFLRRSTARLASRAAIGGAAGHEPRQLQRLVQPLVLARVTWFTSPSGAPRSASIRRPVSTSSIARCLPIARASRWVAPPPGISPTMISGWPNSAVSEATTRSQHQRQLAAAAERVAGHGGDHRRRGIAARRAPRRSARFSRSASIRSPPTANTSGVAGDHDAAHLVVGVEALERLGAAPPSAPGSACCALRVVEPGDAHGPVALRW